MNGELDTYIAALRDIADSRANNQRAADRREYGQCERRVNGCCSPCKFDCKFYRNGRCEYK